MNTLPLNLSQVLSQGLGEETYQQFVDRYLEKYNTAQIDGFDFAPTSLSYTFAQMIASTGATTLPAYVDPESPGYEAALREVQGQTGNIPTQKKFYRLNRVRVHEQLQLIQKVGMINLTPEMRSVFLGLLDEATDGLIASYYSALTHQRMQIVSTGKFTIDATNNPRGLKGIEINFLDPTHKETLQTTKRWWTNAARSAEGSASDPILDMKNKVKEIRRTYHYYGPIQIEMAQDLYDSLLIHSKVLTRIGQSAYPLLSGTATDVAAAQQAYAANFTDEQKASILTKLVGTPVVVRDSYAYVDDIDVASKDIVTKEIENFKVNNVAFVPQGNLGDIQGVTPLTLGYDENKVGRYHDGRLVLSQRAIPETHSIYIESEFAQLCVPSQVRNMFIVTVCPDA